MYITTFTWVNAMATISCLCETIVTINVIVIATAIIQKPTF